MACCHRPVFRIYSAFAQRHRVPEERRRGPNVAVFGRRSDGGAGLLRSRGPGGSRRQVGDRHAERFGYVASRTGTGIAPPAAGALVGGLRLRRLLNIQGKQRSRTHPGPALPSCRSLTRVGIAARGGGGGGARHFILSKSPPPPLAEPRVGRLRSGKFSVLPKTKGSPSPATPHLLPRGCASLF